MNWEFGVLEKARLVDPALLVPLLLVVWSVSSTLTQPRVGLGRLCSSGAPAQTRGVEVRPAVGWASMFEYIGQATHHVSASRGRESGREEERDVCLNLIHLLLYLLYIVAGQRENPCCRNTLRAQGRRIHNTIYYLVICRFKSRDLDLSFESDVVQSAWC